MFVRLIKYETTISTSKKEISKSFGEIFLNYSSNSRGILYFDNNIGGASAELVFMTTLLPSRKLNFFKGIKILKDN